MKEHTGHRGTCAAIMSALLVAVAALTLACGGSTATSTGEPPATTPSNGSAAAQVARTDALVKTLMATWNNAWRVIEDRSKLGSLFADDVMYYDATIDGVITKSDMDAMGQDPTWWKSFRLTLTSSFVSSDGRFAATLGRIALRDKSGGLPWQPAASVLALEDDKVAWEYDYYGGKPGQSKQVEPMLTIPPGVAAAGSTEAQAAVADATATVKQWLAAFNGRDVTTFLSFYSDGARYVDVVSPRWRIMTKRQLANVIASRFPVTEFRSELEPSTESALVSSFFVSADGRFAAVQGTYADARTQQPMLAVLELKDGAIVRQYNFMAVDRGLLRP
jgi:hypothetical protein